MSQRDVNMLIPHPCKDVTLHGKGHLAEVIKDLKLERLF